jgi:hypothetical protein
MRRPARVEKRTAQGVGFIQITVCQTDRGIDWREAERACGAHAGRLVMPRALKPPEHCCIRPFVPGRFYSHLVRNTAVEVLRRSGLQLYRRTVGVVDPEGVYQQTVLTLIHHCASVRVLTGSLRRYGAFCEQVMDTYGAPVIAGEDRRLLDSCVLIAAPGGVTAEQVEGLRAPVLSAFDAERAVGCPVVFDLEAVIPPALADAIPEGIEPTDFLGALYEMGGLQELSALQADGGAAADGRFLSLKSAAI